MSDKYFQNYNQISRTYGINREQAQKALVGATGYTWGPGTLRLDLQAKEVLEAGVTKAGKTLDADQRTELEKALAVFTAYEQDNHDYKLATGQLQLYR
jgi:hypothetical protein